MTHPSRGGRRAPFAHLALLTALVAIPTLAYGTDGEMPAGDARPPEPAARLAVHAPELAPLRRSDVRGGPVFDAAPASFRLRLQRSRELAYRIGAVTALPGETLVLEPDDAPVTYRLEYSAGRVADAPGGWRWTAPTEAGSYALRVAVEGAAEAVHVNVFVLEPRSAMTGEHLRGYRIGRYARDPAHPAPRGFIRVGAADEDILVSPHFTLGQFASKQPGSPRFVALSPPLVVKLEALLEAVNAAGHEASTLHVMSGFRTPWYNRAIGNRTSLSRHLWGDAADVWVDADGDGYMDDLNGDGKRDVADARWLFDRVERIERAGRPQIRVGGLSAYRRNQVHGPFLHVDARGRPARW